MRRALLLALLLAGGCSKKGHGDTIVVNPSPVPTAPAIVVTTPAGPQHGAVTVPFTLSDEQSDPTSVSVEYSADAGATWLPATRAASTAPLTNLPTGTAPGLPYAFVWNSMADGVGLTANPDVRIAMTPSNFETGVRMVTASFLVDNAFVPSTVVSGPPLADVGEHASAAVDGAGDTHIAYVDSTSGDLKYARRGAAWTVETVDAAGSTGWFPSIALTAAGEPRIAYHDAAGALRYASRTGPAWTLSTIDAGPGVGQHASLALDASDNPRVAYHDAANGDLKYASWSAGWTIQTVDAAGNVGAWASLELAPGPRIAYYDATNGDLKYAELAGTWSITTVDAAGTVGLYASLATDGTGEPAVAYYDATAGDLKFAQRSGLAWGAQTVESAGNVGLYASLAYVSGVPRISYRDMTFYLIKVATGPAWSIQLLDAAGLNAGATSIAATSGGALRVAYFDGTDLDLKLALEGAGWTIERADGSPAAYPDVSARVGADGLTRIAFRGATGSAASAIRYAVQSGATWTVTTVDPSSGVGQWPSLALDAANNPRIAYYDQLNGDLKYASWNGASWDLQIVESFGTVGLYPSLSLGATGEPRIAYCAPGLGLRYASWNGAWWTIETAAPAGGQHASLALTATGEPRIAFLDGSSLKLARKTGATWTVETLDAGGEYASLVLDAAGNARVAHHDPSPGDLRFVRWTGTGWTAQAADSAGVVGRFASLGRDSLAIEWVAYADDSSALVRLLWRVGDGFWSSRVVDSAAAPPGGDRMISLALDPDGLPRIACAKNGTLVHSR